MNEADLKPHGDSKHILIGPAGEKYYKDEAGKIITWPMLEDQNTEYSVLTDLKLSLKDIGKIVYVRVTELGLEKITGCEAGGTIARGAAWEQLTPLLSKTRADKDKVLTENLTVQEPEAIEIGWYQDPDGKLYQFDGNSWVDGAVSDKLKEVLEYLG